MIRNIAQLQHSTFISISLSLYISFIQANTRSVSASTMYAMQSNANSCMPSAPSARSGSPPRCCKHLPSYIHSIIMIFMDCHEPVSSRAFHAKERRAFNAVFCSRTKAVVLKHCLKVDRTLGKLLIATKLSVIFF